MQLHVLVPYPFPQPCYQIGTAIRSQDESALKSLIQRHLRWTRSEVARGILGDWDAAKGRFWKVFPHEYAAALRQQVRSAGVPSLKCRIALETIMCSHTRPLESRILLCNTWHALASQLTLTLTSSSGCSACIALRGLDCPCVGSAVPPAHSLPSTLSPPRVLAE